MMRRIAFARGSAGRRVVSRLSRRAMASHSAHLTLGPDGVPVKPERLSVLGKPLQLHSTSPMTGFFRDGFCDVDSNDPGNHSVAGILSKEFLGFSAKRGNNLQAVPGIVPGCKWCLCAARWAEAFGAWKRGEVSKETVPKVVLGATHKKALEGAALKDLEEFSVDK